MIHEEHGEMILWMEALASSSRDAKGIDEIDFMDDWHTNIRSHLTEEFWFSMMREMNT